MKKASEVSVLFVDDEPDMLRSMRRFLRKEPYQAGFAGSAREALAILERQPVDIIVSDLRMPDMDGLALLEQVKSGYPDVIRLIFSANRDMEQIINAINSGEVYRFMSKPLDPEGFKRILGETVEHHLLIAGRRKTRTEIERRLLMSSLPRNLDGIDIAGVMVPSGHLDGDFVDYFAYNPRQVDILIGDVMGKGIQSALVAAAVKHQFAKALAVYDCSMSPRMSCPKGRYSSQGFEQILSRVYRACSQDLLALEMFCTLDFARLDMAAGKLHLFDLGHCPVIRFRAGTGDCTLLKGGNMPLGMVKDPGDQVVTTDIEPGDILVFHTDGVTEAGSPSGELFGIERLAEAVRTHPHLTAAQLAEHIRESIAAFTGRNRFDDDFTCITVRIGTDVNPTALVEPGSAGK